MAAKENPKHIQAMKDDKAPLEYLIASVAPGEARVLKGGADKYGVRNWLIDKIRATTYIGAIRRHLDEWAEGSNVDKDSGQHPLQHIRACCGIVIDAQIKDTLIDDRDRAESFAIDPPKKPQAAEPLVTVTYRNTQLNANHIERTRTKTFGPFTSMSDAVEFVRQTRGQMPGTASFNTLLPITVPETQNDRDRNQETNVGSDRIDRGAAHRSLASGDADASARANIREALRRAEGGPGAGLGKD